MKPYQERVIEERTQLGERIGRLSKFLGGHRDIQVDPQELSRMRIQLAIMQAYEAVLKERIGFFERGVEPTTDPVVFARKVVGNLFTRGELVNVVLPVDDIEASIQCILAGETTGGGVGDEH